MSERILILGGVAAGMSAASQARRTAPEARIQVLEAGPIASYSACGIPFVLSGAVAGMERLAVYSREYLQNERRLEVFTSHTAVEIALAERKVRATSPQGERWFAFDRLVIATGARPRGACAGVNPGERLFQPYAWQEAVRLEQQLRAASPPRRALVIGGGYIGLEMADALRQKGLEVTLVEAGEQLLRGMDAELSEALEKAARAAGVQLRLGTRVQRLEPYAGGERLRAFSAAGELSAELALDCSGLAPRTELAEAAGIQPGRSGGLAVDERQQTNQAGVYAAGDCAESRHRVSGAPAWLPLGAVANQQGRVAGQNAAGGPPARFPGVLGSLAVRVFGIEAGRTGLSSQQARTAGFRASALQIEAAAAAGYLGRQRLQLRLIYEEDSQRLLGCQMVGEPGTILPRLHAAATALAAGMRLEEIEMLDLAYSPPLSPVYDPLRLAAHRARSQSGRARK